MLAAVAAACLLLVAAFARLIFNTDYPAIWGIVILLFAVAFVPMLMERVNGSFDLFNLKNAFVLYFILQFGVWTIMILTTGETRLLPSFDSSAGAITLSLIYAVIGLLAFYVGYYSKIGRLAVKLPYLSERINPFRLWVLQVVLAVLVLFSFFGLMARGGGFTYFVTHIDKFRTESLLGSGFLFHGISLMSTAFLIYAAYKFSRHENLIWIYIYAAVCMLVSMMAGFRHMTIYTLAYLLITRNYLHKKIKLKFRHVIVIALLLQLNTIYVYSRSHGYLVETNGFISALSDLDYGAYTEQTSLSRFHGTESFARIIETIPNVGYQYGKYFFTDVVLFIIPRDLWPDKPIMSGLRHNTLFWPEYFDVGDTGAIIPTLPGELYWMAGPLAVVAGMFFMGVLLKAAYAYMRNNTSLGSVAIYAVAFWFAMLVNETISLHTVSYIFVLLTLLLCLSFVTSSGPDASGEPNKVTWRPQC